MSAMGLPLTIEFYGKELYLYSEGCRTDIRVNDIVKIVETLSPNSITVIDDPATGEKFAIIPSKEERLLATINDYLGKDQSVWGNSLVMLINLSCTQEEAVKLCTYISNPTFVDKVMQSYGYCNL